MADMRPGEGIEEKRRMSENGLVGSVHGGEGRNTAEWAPKLKKKSREK